MDIKIPIVLLTLVVVFSSAVLTPQNEEQADLLRVRRQESTSSTTSTTTARPKRRPSNIFSLFSTLLAETRDDARRAFSEIGTIFNSQFTANTPRPIPTKGPIVSSTTTTTTVNSTETGEDVTTTTEAYKITREEFNGILNSNIRGIVSLFRKELSNAITDSGKNVREFGRELRTQIRPYVEIRNRRLS